MKYWLCFLLMIPLAVFATPKVVVSIKPFHDLTLAVMEGSGAEPVLLVPPGGSPHHYALAPSQAKALYQADLIIWVGPELEQFLTQPLAQSRKDSILLTVLEIPGMTLYHTQGDHQHGTMDPHLWLDPTNLMLYVTELANTLAKLDPKNTERYQTNARNTVKQLEALDETVKAQLKPLHRHPIMVFHDGYQYFSKRYGLDVVGTVLLKPEVMPSVSHVLDIQQTLKSKNVQCIFSEPQFKPAIVERLVAGTSVKTGVLDPLGSAHPVGILGTQALFNDLSRNLIGCVES